jgi:hypothetical protein
VQHCLCGVGIMRVTCAAFPLRCGRYACYLCRIPFAVWALCVLLVQHSICGVGIMRVTCAALPLRCGHYACYLCRIPFAVWALCVLLVQFIKTSMYYCQVCYVCTFACRFLHAGTVVVLLTGLCMYIRVFLQKYHINHYPNIFQYSSYMCLNSKNFMT